ncbi:MAG TPA: NAD(P)-dependent oxidoreductase [Chloroflexota bacterium]|nr:NAD(P)-dependent oxidoreductase [Chloroflexota bacterium]
MPRRILLTGAAGSIGTAFRHHAGDRYWFRLADGVTHNLADATTRGHDVLALDIADLAACQEACKTIDTVIHLAADAGPGADFYGSLLDNNVKGTYNIFRAAKDQGCRRVIFASSAQVVAGYPRDVQARPETPVRPVNMYGVSKCFGEAVASYFAHAEGLPSIAIRIGAYDVGSDDVNWLRREPNPLNLSAYVSARDLSQLLVRCVEATDVQFAVVHGISDNRFKRLDITSTRDLLGYAPQDDAFDIFANHLRDWLQG